MGGNRKTVLPGEHLSSAMEFEPGENAYVENDEIYSAAVGEAKEEGKALAVRGSRQVIRPVLGMEVYCMVRRCTATKAFLDCVPAAQADSPKGPAGAMAISAVLPVTEIRREHVRDIRDEVKSGDIIKAKINKVERTMIDVSIFGAPYGVLVAFCPKCRSRMVSEAGTFVCGGCHWRDRRKVPGAGGPEGPREGGYREGGGRPYGGERRTGGGFGGRERRGPPREGGYGRGPPRGPPGERRGEGYGRGPPRERGPEGSGPPREGGYGRGPPRGPPGERRGEGYGRGPPRERGPERRGPPGEPSEGAGFAHASGYSTATHQRVGRRRSGGYGR